MTDPGAQLPAFGQYLHSLVARAVNASLGRWESFWAPSSYSAVALASPDDILEKAAYVLANPAAAGLVRRGREWPGLWSAPEQVGAAPTTAPRPATFFSTTGYMPESAELELTVPPGFESAHAFRDRLATATAALEANAADERSAAGVDFMGPAHVRAQRPTARPHGLEPRRNLRPRVGARDKWKRIEVLSRLVEFLRAYQDAWRARRAGRTDVVFPAGTYLLRVLHDVPCATCAPSS